jgi:hypothetical protein
MILAALDEKLAIALSLAVMLTMFGALVVLIVKGHRRFRSTAERAQQKAFEGVEISETPRQGMVAVVFHTYYGLLVFTHQTEYRFWALPEDARLVLSRLNRFNLTWGFFACGAIFIPLLSLGNYWAQRARIRKQATALAKT